MIDFLEIPLDLAAYLANVRSLAPDACSGDLDGNVFRIRKWNRSYIYWDETYNGKKKEPDLADRAIRGQWNLPPERSGQEPVSAKPVSDSSNRALVKETLSRFGTVREWATFDFGRQQDPACLAVMLAPDKAASALSAIRAAIPAGTVAFRTANETEIVVGPGQDQFDILRLARTSAPNSNLSTEQIIEHLQRLDERLGINIVRAESDRVDFNLNSQPQDIQAFAESIYEFCPDVVDQALGSLDMLIMQIDIASYVWLWWD